MPSSYNTNVHAEIQLTEHINKNCRGVAGALAIFFAKVMSFFGGSVNGHGRG
ncbi:hypothetical protein CY34DRAFT_807374 [Suillus luteus UH-Slu-Lm8-n1]|uniref:Uncharacterized protein n=1 Tax=Suillus luteus UH-Slu-Lm8-n1 TaxID=930992 RepID=A0A0D0B975_9AGAM|nr:hypothetical protein CY34DRAFT_807374 [Suillus luteus UH-Slu-Lm8-n1]